MKLTCKKCKTVIEIPDDVTRATGARPAEVRLICPGCQTRYRLRPRKTVTPQAKAPPAEAPRAAVPGATPPSAAAGLPSHPSLTPATPMPTQAPLQAPLAASTQPDIYDQPTVAARRPLAPSGPVFQDGELLSGRYRIVRFLARGGMGEVYEAEDLELRQHVALKTISAHAGEADEAAVERFKREIALARSVTHPNVCRIFDLGRHRPASADPDGPKTPPVTFLTMELLEGETLSACLIRRGRLSTAEALPLVEQMAAALAAAHRAQVVHRDFKSENVFLVPEDAGTGGDPRRRRVAVTDFGVARGGADDRFAAQVTGTGIVGTPAYMAPEQVEGGAITPATDIYALGIVIYEMVTGRLPFDGPNPLSTAVKRLQEPPPPPHVYVLDLEAWWERAILRCLKRDPAERFATADELIAALQPPVRRPGAARPETAPAPAPPRPAPAPGMAAAAAAPASNRRSLVLGLVLMAVIVASAALYIFNRDRELDRSRVVPRRSVAVLGFKNLTGQDQDAWLGTALAEMLTTELARGEALRTIPGENVARMWQQLGLEASPSLDGADLERVRSLLGSDFLVVGSYAAIGEAETRELRLDLRLQDAALGSTVVSLARDGRQEELFRLISELGGELRNQLGVDEAGGADDPLAGLPSEPEAARLYAQAVDELRDSRPRAARELLESAARLAPQNALVHSALSQAWEGEGFGGRAAEAAERAFELSSGLSREDRLAVEGRYREVTGDWPAAVEVYGELCEYFPDDLEYGLRLVAAHNSGRDPKSALRTIDDLRRLPAPISEDPRIDLAEASAAGLDSDFTRQLEAAGRAADGAAQIDAGLLVAQARLAEAQAHRVLGRLSEAEIAAREASRLYADLGHLSGAAQALTALGNVHFDRGEFDEAADCYRQVTDDYRRLGDQDGTASGLNNLALVLKKRGDLDGARALYTEATAIFETTGDDLAMTFALNNLGVLLVEGDRLSEAGSMFERARAIWQDLGNKRGLAYSLNNIAAVRHLMGELAASRDQHEQALEIRREIGEKTGEATSLTNLADALYDLGEIKPASEHLERALELTAEIGDRSARAHTLHVLGRVRLQRDALAEARDALGESLELRRELAESRRVTDTRISLARLALEAGDPAAAETESLEAILECREQDRLSEESRATTILARALLAQHRLKESREAAEGALRLAEPSEQPAIRLRATIVASRVRAAAGEVESALESLEEVEDKSLAAGYGVLHLEAKLAWAELGLMAGRETEARERLLSIESDAAVRGLGLLARKAGAVSPTP
ncbi:MAG: tetratricopeptide repeat protein [bacterium]|nr:tetratricopeptide repeat protein [bacterium]